MAEFDYNSPDVDADTVAAVVADISGNKTPPPVSDEQRAEHERWREECHCRDQQTHAEYERQQAEKLAAEQLERERLQAIARTERAAKLKAEMDERSRRLSHGKSLTDLLNHSIEQRAFRQQMLRSQAKAESRKRLSAALDNALAALNPPPPPEPTVVVVPEDDGSADLGSRNFDVAKWSKKPRSWW